MSRNEKEPAGSLPTLPLRGRARVGETGVDPLDLRWDGEVIEVREACRLATDVELSESVFGILRLQVRRQTMVKGPNGRLFPLTGTAEFVLTRTPSWPYEAPLAVSLGLRTGRERYPLVHPNILAVDDGPAPVCCFGNDWDVRLHLVDVVVRVVKLVTYHHWTAELEHAINPEATAWALSQVKEGKGVATDSVGFDRWVPPIAGAGR